MYGIIRLATLGVWPRLGSRVSGLYAGKGERPLGGKRSGRQQQLQHDEEVIAEEDGHPVYEGGGETDLSGPSLRCGW